MCTQKLLFLQCTASPGNTRKNLDRTLYRTKKRTAPSAIESRKQQQSCRYRMIATTIDLCRYLLFDNAALKEECSNVGQYFVNRRIKSCELHGEAPANGVKMNVYSMPHCKCNIMIKYS